VATTGIVLQEVLQGTRTERDLNLLRARLGRLPFLRADKETHVDAARLYRKALERGWVIPAADAPIAATALAHGVALLTTDHGHVRALARVSKLRRAA
jgi:tRNA(fMet)-specific endonuclease VapC